MPVDPKGPWTPDLPQPEPIKQKPPERKFVPPKLRPKPVVKYTGAQPIQPIPRPDLTKYNVPRREGLRPIAPIQPKVTPAQAWAQYTAEQGLDLQGVTQAPLQASFAPDLAQILSDVNIMQDSTSRVLGAGVFNDTSIGDDAWWNQASGLLGIYDLGVQWFKGGLLGLNFIQKIPERLYLMPMIAGWTGRPDVWWASQILKDLGYAESAEELITVLNPKTGEEGQWSVNAMRGWQFSTTSALATHYASWAAKKQGLTAEGDYVPNWKAERAWDFEKMVTDPDTGKIKWDVLVGKYDASEPDFLNQLFDTTGLSGISVSLALQPEKWERFTKMIDDDAPMHDVILELEDPWAEFAFNVVTDPLLWVGVLAPAKMAKFTYMIWPPSYPLEKASAWALSTIFRSGFAAKGAIFRELYEKQGSARRWLLGISKSSQHSAYSDAVEDTMRTLALRYDPAVDPSEPIEFFQRVLLGDDRLIEGKLGPQRTAQLKDAIALLGETLELDISTILEHYGPFADLLGGKQIAEVALEGALKDPEAIGYYLSQAISNQYAKQLGVHRPSQGSLARYLNWASRLLKEQWLAINAGYLVNNFGDNTMKTIVSNYNPTFDLHASAKLATYLGDTFDEVLPANVAQSLVADAFDVERHLATADLPWPLGEPEGWAKMIRFITGKKIPQRVYDWMIGDSKAIVWLRQANYSGLLRRGFNVSASIEQSARAGLFVNALDDYITNQGMDKIIEYVARNPDIPQEFTEFIINKVVRKPADFDTALARIVGRLDEAVPETWVSGMAPAGTPDFEFVQELRRTLDDIQTSYSGDYGNPQFARKITNAFARARKAARTIFQSKTDEVLFATKTELEFLAEASGDPRLYEMADEAAKAAGVVEPPRVDPDYEAYLAEGRLTIQDMARAAEEDIAYAFGFDPDLLTQQLDMAAAGRYPNNPVIGVLFEDLPNADSLRMAAREYADTPAEEIYRQALEQYNLKYRFPKGLPPIGQAFPIDLPAVTTPRVGPRVIPGALEPSGRSLYVGKGAMREALKETPNPAMVIHREHGMIVGGDIHEDLIEAFVKDVGIDWEGFMEGDIAHAFVMHDEKVVSITSGRANLDEFFDDFLEELRGAGLDDYALEYAARDTGKDFIKTTVGEALGIPPVTPIALDTAGRATFTADQLASAKPLLEREGQIRLAFNEKTGVAAIGVEPEEPLIKIFDTLSYTEDMADDFWDMLAEDNPITEWTLINKAGDATDLIDDDIMFGLKETRLGKGLDQPVYIMHDPDGGGYSLAQIKPLVDAGLDPNGIIIYSASDGSGQMHSGTLGQMYAGFVDGLVDDAPAAPSIVSAYNIQINEWEWHRQSQIIDHVRDERSTSFMYDVLNGQIIIGEPGQPHMAIQVEKYSGAETQWTAIEKQLGEWYVDVPAGAETDWRLMKRVQRLLQIVGEEGDDVFNQSGQLMGKVGVDLDFGASQRLVALEAGVADPFMRYDRTDLGPAIVFDPTTGEVSSGVVHYDAATHLGKDEKTLQQFRIDRGKLAVFGSIYEGVEGIYGQNVTQEAFQALLDAGIPGDMMVTGSGVDDTLANLAANFELTRTIRPMFGDLMAVDDLWDASLGVAGYWDDVAGEFNFRNWSDYDGNLQITKALDYVADEGKAGNEILNVVRPATTDPTFKVGLDYSWPEADRVMADFLKYLDNLGIAGSYPIELNGARTTFQTLKNTFEPFMKGPQTALIEQFGIRDLSNASRAMVNQLKLRLAGGSFPTDEQGIVKRLIGVHYGDGNIVWTTQSNFHNPLMDYVDRGVGEVGAFTISEGKGVMTSTVDYDMALSFAKSLEDLGAADNLPFRVYLTGPEDVSWPYSEKEFIGSLGEFLGREVQASNMVLSTTDNLMGAQAQLGHRNALVNENVMAYQAINSSLNDWDGLAANRIAQGIDTKYVSGPESEAATTAVKGLKDEWVEMLEDATYHGIGETNRVLFDYQARNSWEEVLRQYAPFTTWQLRNPMFWAQAFTKQPSLLATAVAYHRASEISRKQRNLTGRFKGTVGFDTPAGGYMAADVSKIISIFGQYQQPFEAPGTELEPAPGLMGAMQWIVQQGRSFGLNPWPWVSYPMERAELLPEGTTQLSVGPQQRALEMALQQAGVLEPGEGLLGMSPTSEFLMGYWTERRLTEMEAEGLIDHGTFLEAISDPEHEQRQVAKDWVYDLQTKFGLAGLANPFTLKYASPGEVQIRENLKEKRELPPELKQWYNTAHPYLESYNSLFQGEVERAVSAVYYKYEELLRDWKPWDDEYKQLSAERAIEIESLSGPQAPAADLKVEYLANPIQIGAPDDIGGTYDATSAQTSTLHRMRDIEPRAGDYVLEGGEIDWETYNTDLDNFMNNIEVLSEEMGMPVTVESYIKFRYRWASPERVAYDLYKQWRSDGWEKYESLQPEADDFLDLINWAAEQQHMKDLSIGFTPLEAGKLKAENLAVWAIQGLPYEYRQELLGEYGRPKGLATFSGTVADILGMDMRGEERFVLAHQLKDTLPDIFGEDDPIQSMTNDMYDYYYNLMPDEKGEVREFLGLDTFDLAGLDDSKVTAIHRQLGLRSDRTKLIMEGVLMYDEPQGMPILPTWDELTPEEERDIEQLRVDWYRYNKARDTGVYGTWTDLMTKYYSNEDSGAGLFWGMLNGISLSSAAFDDPVVGPLLSKATREILQPTDEQYEVAATYLQEHLPELIDQEKTQLIRDHPNWYELAQIQRGDFDRYRVLDMEILKGQYYAIYYKNRDKWKGEHPEEWEALRGYMAREKARALAFPYYAFFFKSYDYRNFYGGRTPNEIPEELAPQLSEDYLSAIDDLEAYLTGQTDEWTDAMNQFFGAPAPISPEDSMWIPANEYHEAGRHEVNKYVVGEQLYGFKHDPRLTDHAKKFLESTVKVIGVEPREREGRVRAGYFREERDLREHTSLTIATTDLRNINLMRHEAAHAIDNFYEVSSSIEFQRTFFPMDTHSKVVSDAIDDPYRRVEAAFDAISQGGYMPVSWALEFFAFLFAELAANPEDVPPEIKEFYEPYIKFP